MISQTPTEPAEHKTTFNYGYIIVLASFIMVMMNVGMYLTIGVFFKPISLEMGWTRADTSLPIGLSTIVTAVCTIIAGTFFDRFGPRKVAFAFATITGAGYLLMSTLSNLWQLYIYFGLLIGAGASLMAPLLSLIPRWFAGRRTVMAGVISAGGGVGGLFMPLLANWLIDSYSWQRAYLIMGIGYLVVALTAVQFLRRSPPFIADAVPMKSAVLENANAISPQSYPLNRVFQSRNFWLMVIMCASFGYIANMINLHTSPHATDVGFSSTQAAGLLSIMNGISIIGAIVLGAFGDKFGNRRMLAITFILEGGVLIWMIFIRDLWMLDAVMVIYGLAFGSGLAQTSPLVAKLFGTRSLGLILGIITFAQTIGSGLGVYIPGFIYDFNHNYFWAYIICGILGAAAFCATLTLKMNNKPKTHPEKKSNSDLFMEG
jgi:MFS family permease